MAEEKKTIKFEYKILPSYAIYPVSGIYGGLNAHGEIVASLFHERSAIPREQVYAIWDGKAISAQPESEEKKESIIRNVMLSITCNPSVARSIAGWLNDKADQYEKIIAEPKKGE